MAATATTTRAGQNQTFDASRRHTRSKSLLQPLRLLGTDFRDRVRAGLHARSHGALQPSHAGVIVNLDTSGTRLTELAERAGITKQAMGKLVAELEAIGYVRLAADPADGRAKIVRFSDAGLELLADSADVVDDIWEYYAALLGERRLVTLRGSLATLLARIDEDS